MHLILVDNLIVPEEGSMADMDVHPHLGLLALAAAAKQDGHRVTIVDPKRLVRSGHLTLDADLYQRFMNDLLRAPGRGRLHHPRMQLHFRGQRGGLPGSGPNRICRSCWAGRTRPCCTRRYWPASPSSTWWQGTNPMKSSRLSWPPSPRDFRHIPGVSWRDRQGVHFTEGRPKVADLDLLPLFDYDLYPVGELGLDLLRIEAGRGCPFACTFCSTVEASSSAASGSSRPNAWCWNWTACMSALASAISSSTMTCSP
ncbi:hypothetical protein LP420_21990 [Massilia sp. B-10]|nr:hypothetical protein LP420_21990 [Massilia sp. B-10]